MIVFHHALLIIMKKFQNIPIFIFANLIVIQDNLKSQMEMVNLNVYQNALKKKTISILKMNVNIIVVLN